MVSGGPIGGHRALKRELGLLAVTLSGVGIILGAGIYALLGQGAGLAGNAVWLSFVISAVIALLTGLSYAELSSMLPKAAAEYEYTARAFGRRAGFVIGWLVIASGVIGAATVATGFGGYFTGLFIGIPPIYPALALLAVVSMLLYIGVRESTSVAILFTLIETSGLLFIIAVGLPYLGSVDYLEMPLGIGGVLQGAALLFFAYQGFEEMVKMSEETKDPERTVPQGLMLAVIITIVLYVFTAISAVSVQGWQALAGTSAPFAEVARVAVGDTGQIVLSIIALFATANTVLLMLFASSRITYGMAASRALPAALARVHPIRRTPHVAIAVMMVVAMLFLFGGDIGFIASMTNFTLFVTFAVINGVVLVLRIHDPDAPRPFRVPGSIGRIPILPILGIATCGLLILQLEATIIALGCILTAIGAVVATVGIPRGSR